MREEGLYLGTSSGINVAGSVKMAHALGPGHTVVTVLCDLATRYQEKIFNCSFLDSKGLSTPSWIDDGMSDIIKQAKYSSLVPEAEATAEQRMAEEKKEVQVANIF